MELSTTTMIFIILILVGLGFGVWGLLRWRYVRSLEDRGWEFDPKPTMGLAVGLNHAPFGAGFERKVDDLVLGRAPNGVPFEAFEYEYVRWRSDHYVVRFPLPSSMPFLYVTSMAASTSIPDLPSGWVGELGGHAILAADERYGRDVGGLLTGSLGALASHELSIDHAFLVVHDVGARAEELARVVEAGGLLAERLATKAAEYPAPPAPNHLSFNHRPHWRYIAHDSSWLQAVRHDRGGFDHRASDIVTGERDGISFIRLRHDWKTRSRDSEGRTQTHHHHEFLCEFRLRFPFRDLDLGTSVLGVRNDRTGIQFESAAFNRAYRVRASSSKFAHDVLHPRMMEWLLAQDRPRFEIQGDGTVRFDGYGEWEVPAIAHAERVLRGFLARVPDFVYDNLGAERPVPEEC